jgi:transcription-repair coupling factor (superfamily II helicase)
MIKKSLQRVNPSFLGYFFAKNEELIENHKIFALFPEERDGLDFLNVFSFFSKKKSAYFPPTPVLPFSESIAITSAQFERIKVLWEFPTLKVVATTIQALMRKTLPREVLRSEYIYLIPGEEIPRETLVQGLVNLGYERVGVVEEKGSFSVKGMVVDIFSPQYDHPARVEFFGDEVVSLRLFDCQTQKSIKPLEELIILPAREAFFPRETKPIYERVLSFKDKVNPKRLNELLSQVEHRKVLENEDFLLPLFFPNLKALFENSEEKPLFLLYELETLKEKAYEFWDKVSALAHRAKERGRLMFEESLLYIPPQELFATLEKAENIIAREAPFANEPSLTFEIKEVKDLLLKKERHHSDKIEEGFFTLLELLEEGYSVYLFVASSHAKEVIQAGLKSRGAHDLERLTFVSGDLRRGFIFPQEAICVTSEFELFGKRSTKTPQAKPKGRFRRFEDLKPGDFVVHRTYGIGRYLGLKTLAVNGMEGDFLEIEYADGDKLYLPPARLDELYPYVGVSDKEPKLDKLGKQTFLKRRREVEKRLTEVVQEILTIYAERRAMPGYSLSFPALAYQQFVNTFPYEETPDQASAIEDVISDLCQDKLMERLVVGDVGFGKTEVALRAAFITAYNGKQVAVLVPTTILAEQHYQTFKERLSPFGIEVGVLSRLRNPKEIKETLEGLAKGKVQVVIGTHRLLSSDVQFKDLGLLIIDEEHRFGVKQKEKLKQLKKSTKVLILSATPIPRSLQLSLLGIFDLSVIETPPQGRKTIITYIARFDREVIKSAIEAELSRGGQVYFVHPRIKGLASLAHFIKELVPSARVEVIHGQMPEEVLEKNLYKFLKKEVDVLVCTPIIGSGVDIPTANTIIINRADMFGLADLYQLRGRVGRADVQAYAYLLVPDLNSLTEEARKRLRALMQHTELGSGFKLAMSDLKIRGAGELLGLNQSGHINAVGYELYLELLENTIRALKGEKIEDWEPEVNLKVQAYIPQSYVPDPEERLSLYRELVLCKTEEDLFEFKSLLEDKYGKVPKEAETLLKIYHLKLLMRKHGILQVEEKGSNLLLIFKNAELVPRLRSALKNVEDIKVGRVEAQKGLIKMQLTFKKEPLDLALSLISRL